MLFEILSSNRAREEIAMTTANGWTSMALLQKLVSQHLYVPSAGTASASPIIQSLIVAVGGPA